VRSPAMRLMVRAGGCRSSNRVFLLRRPREAIDAAHAFDEVTAALRGLPRLIPEIRSFKRGPDVGVNAGNWDFAVVASSTRSTTRPSIASIRCTSA
jgi:hypothetical protein